MGILEAPVVPDTFGLPDYHVTEIIYEIVGTDVRMACGIKRFGQTHWLYTVTMPADRLLIEAFHGEAVACDAVNMLQLVGSGKGH